MFHHKIINFHPDKLNKSFELSIIKLFLTFAFATIQTIWAVYMKEFGLNNSQIGLINSFLLIISLFFLFSCVNILEKFSEKKSFILSIITSIIILILIPLFQNLYIFLIFAIILLLSKILDENSFNIFFRDNTSSSKLNENQALLSVLGNIAWFLGPILAGFILLEYGFNIVFYSASLFMMITLILFFKIKIKKNSNKNLKKTYKKKSYKFLIKNFIKKKQTHLPYLMSAGVSLWWGFIFVYMPLFIIESKLGKEYIGLFIGFSQLPLILLEYYAGKKSNKIGFKKLFNLGFFGVSILAFLCFIINDIIIKLCLLILASFFMALIEPLRYSFIFSKIKKSDEEEIIPLFSSSLELGSFIGKISIAILLIFLSNKYSYLLISIFMFIFFLISLKIKN